MTPAVRTAAVAAAAVTALLLVRPGFVAQSVRSPLAWLTVLGVLLLVAATRYVVRRTVGPRAAAAAGLVVVLAATLLLVGPSFRQRTLNEPLPAALQAAAAPADVPTASALPVVSRRAAPPASPAAALASPAVAPVVPPPTSAPRVPSASPSPPATTTGKTGRLRGIDHDASGRIVLYTGSTGLVRFESVDIEGSVGPSVHLIPYGSRTPAGGLRLGGLKAERGSFSYRLPASVDLSKPWTVLVWCDPYDVPIAAADLT